MSAMKNPLEINFQTMTSQEVTASLNACRYAGAWEAAERLSKHIASVELKLLLTRVELQEILKDLDDQTEGDSAMSQRPIMSHDSAMLPPLQAGLHEVRKLGWRRRVRNWLLRLFRRPVIL